MNTIRVQILETEELGGGFGPCVLRSIRPGHRLQPDAMQNGVLERYYRVPSGYEMQRWSPDGGWGPATNNPLDYLPGIATMSLIDAVRLHHRTQMRHARRVRTPGIAAVNIYQEIA